MTVQIVAATISNIVTDSGPSNTDFYTNDTTLTVSGAVITDHGSGANGIISVWAVQGSSFTFIGTASVSATATTWTATTPTVGLLPGTYTLQVFRGIAHNGNAIYTQPTPFTVIDTINPTQTAPSAQTDDVPPGTIVFGSTTSNAITVADNNPDTLSVKFAVTDGAMSVTGTAAGVTVSGSSTATLTITGTATAINSFINNNLTYTTTSTSTVVGIDDTLTVTTTDQAGNVSTPSTVFIDVTCFMPGTMIRTPDGEVAVESLECGDLVLTMDGRAAPVRWLGRQTVSTIFGNKERILPIRIKAGALDENTPSRDLLVSPDHALLVDGALIQAGALVNGTSILRETNVPRIFTYYHVELDDHCLILAENTPAESFVDNVDRLRFDNWAEHEALYPEGKAISELPYPRAKSQRQVPVSTRVRLADRGLAIGAVNSDVA